MATHDVCVVDDCKVSHHGYRLATMPSSSPTYLNPLLAIQLSVITTLLDSTRHLTCYCFTYTSISSSLFVPAIPNLGGIIRPSRHCCCCWPVVAVVVVVVVVVVVFAVDHHYSLVATRNGPLFDSTHC